MFWLRDEHHLTTTTKTLASPYFCFGVFIDSEFWRNFSRRGCVCQNGNQLHSGLQTADHMYNVGCTLYRSIKCTLPMSVYKLKTCLEKKKKIFSKHLAHFDNLAKLRYVKKFLKDF
jgi:hypothetical protein